MFLFFYFFLKKIFYIKMCSHTIGTIFFTWNVEVQVMRKKISFNKQRDSTHGESGEKREEKKNY